MQAKKLSLIVALVSLNIIMLASSPFANGIQACITKEILNECPYWSDPTSGLGIYPDEPYVWFVKINVTNLGAETMMDVYLKDRFGGEFAVEVVESHEGLGLPVNILSTKGMTEKVSLDWWPGDLDPGDSFWVILEVSTDINPGGRPEFTECGCYCLNSGATVRWKGGSASTGTIWVTTY